MVGGLRCIGSLSFGGSAIGPTGWVEDDMLDAVGPIGTWRWWDVRGKVGGGGGGGGGAAAADVIVAVTGSWLECVVGQRGAAASRGTGRRMLGQVLSRPNWNGWKL